MNQYFVLPIHSLSIKEYFITHIQLATCSFNDSLHPSLQNSLHFLTPPTFLPKTNNQSINQSSIVHPSRLPSVLLLLLFLLLALPLPLSLLASIHVRRSIIELILALPMALDSVPFPSRLPSPLRSSPASGPLSSSSSSSGLFSALYTRGISLICTDGQPSISRRCSHTC